MSPLFKKATNFILNLYSITIFFFLFYIVWNSTSLQLDKFTSFLQFNNFFDLLQMCFLDISFIKCMIWACLKGVNNFGLLFAIIWSQFTTKLVILILLSSLFYFFSNFKQIALRNFWLHRTCSSPFCSLGNVVLYYLWVP